MLKKLLLVGAAAFATSASALDSPDIQKSVELKDGSTLYVFKDGKMAMESKFGRTERMAPGHVMESKDGQKITMQGDEVGRLENIRTTSEPGG